MAERFDVSMSSGEKKLINWIRNQMQNNEISPSLVFRDAMLKKKAEWDEKNSENPKILHKRIDTLRKTLENNSQRFFDFIDSKKLTKEWTDFYNNNEIKPKKQKGFIKEITEKNPEIPEQKIGATP